jgi:hypothetical protein
MRSRRARKPLIGKNGKPIVAQITPGDLELFKLLNTFGKLQSDDIHVHRGGSLDYLIDRLDLLHAPPNLYIKRPPKQWDYANANYHRIIYELDRRGEAFLVDHGHAIEEHPHSNNFQHDVMACRILASVALGAKKAGGRMIHWPQIYDELPPATQNLKEPWFIHGYKRPDSKPFGIFHNDTYTFYAGVEADRNTESLRKSKTDPERNSIEEKLISYARLAKNRLYREHFGFPNYFVPFITTTKTRAQSFQDLLTLLVKEGAIEEKYSKIFIFGVFPSLTSYGPKLPTDGRMFHVLARRN